MREGGPQMEKERMLARLSCSSLPSFHWTLFWKCVLCGALSVLFKCSTSFQVVSYLDSEDLLKLCRLSKGSRALFLSKNSAAVWRNVLARVADLPKCPQDLTEPQYASLIFDKFCMASVPSFFKISIDDDAQGCGSTRGNIETQYLLRLRLCQGCSNKK